jgi:hypothetical protein
MLVPVLVHALEDLESFGRREGKVVSLQDVAAGLSPRCSQWGGPAHAVPGHATAGPLACAPRGASALEVSFTISSQALADEFPDPSFAAIMDNRLPWRGREAAGGGRLRLAGSVSRVGRTAAWRVLFSVPTTLPSGTLFHVSVHMRLPNWRFFEQPSGRAVHSIIHNHDNKADASWQDKLAQADRDALVVHNTPVFDRSFSLGRAPPPSAAAAPPLPFCDEVCAAQTGTGVMRGDVRSPSFWEGTGGGWQPPTCNFRRFYTSSCRAEPSASSSSSSSSSSSCFAVIPTNTSIVFIADSNGQHTQGEFLKLPQLALTKGANHFAFPGTGGSTFQWRFFRGIGGDGLSGHLLHAGLRHLYKDKPLADLPIDLRLELSAMQPAANLCVDTLMDRSLTSRLGEQVTFISAGLWPVIYKWQAYTESLAWGVRLAKEDCVRRGLPITVFWVESMATNATTGSGAKDVGAEWRSTWDKRLEEQERLVRKILEPAVDGIVPMHAITGSIDHHIAADGHHQTHLVYKHVGEVLLNYALSVTGKCSKHRRLSTWP